jgi:glycosyltransferase involved in cell wall biosynthesis
VGFVGTAVAWQNIPSLITAIANLRRRGCNLLLRIAGDGADLAACRSAAAACPEAVSFHGRIPHAEVATFLAGVDIGYSGQRAEPGRRMYHSPLKLAEYMAAGLPFIASRYPDALSAASGVGEHLLFDAESPSGPEQALAWTWRERERLAEIGAEMRRRAELHLGWSGRVATLLSALRERGIVA